MACLDVNRGGIAALSRSDMEFLTFDFQRHDKLIEQLIEVAAEFRERCMNGDAPDVDGSDSTSLTLKAMYPRPTPDNTVQLPATAAMWASEWAGVKESVKILEDRERLLKNQLIEAIGDGEYGACGDLMFSYKAQTRNGYLKVSSAFWEDLIKSHNIPFEEIPETTFRVLREVKAKAKKGEQKCLPQ
jgi:predicted phage-related endonuclease